MDMQGELMDRLKGLVINGEYVCMPYVPDRTMETVLISALTT